MIEYEDIKLRLHVDKHDANDAFEFYKGCGPLPINHGKSEGCDMHFGGPGMNEVVSAPFTGEGRGMRFSKSPPFHDFNDDLTWTFESLCVRVVVSRPKTGRRAVLWKEDDVSFERQEPDEDHPLGFFIEPRAGSRRVFSNTVRLRAPAQAFLPPSCKTDNLEAEFSFYVERKGWQQENGYGGRWCVAKAKKRKQPRLNYASVRMNVSNADIPVVNYFIRAMLMASP